MRRGTNAMEMAKPKARKIHTKSRKGCQECKRRHIKCDETFPCSRCTASGRQCSYVSSQSPVRVPAPAPRSSSSIPPGLIPAQQAPGFSSSRIPTQSNLPLEAPVASSLPSYTAINLDHLELLHHFEAETCKTIAITNQGAAAYHKAVMSRAFCNQHLMSQILALSALHLSLHRIDRQAFYQKLASDMQSAALVGFQELLENVDGANCVDVLLFSHHVALHVFCDTFNALRDDFGEFLERFVACIRLLNGVRTVMNEWGTELEQTEIGNLIRDAARHQKDVKPSEGECRDLQAMIRNADLSQASIHTCHSTLEELQHWLDLENSLEEPSASSNMIFSWLIKLSSDFTDLLDQRKPEALVILAYYAVLLHKRRDSWVVGDAGGRLFRRINQYLGSRWQDWMAWPLSVLGGATSNVTSPVETLTRSETSSTLTPA